MHFTVVVNPASGKRTAKQALVTLKQRLIDSGCWKEDPAPSVDDRNHTFSVFETLHAGHGFTIASELAMINASRSGELDQSLNLILLGGDGLVHEVINGVLAAESFKSKVLMAVIPCGLYSYLLYSIDVRPNQILKCKGSGNALATTLGIKDIDDGINRVLAFNFSTSLAIQTVCVNYTNTNITHTEISKPIYSFCVVSWGLHAQIVRQSDWFRFMGNKRFSLAAWLNIMFFKQYWARFSVDASASCKKITTKEDETTPLLQEQIYTAASAFKAADLFEQDTSGFQTVFSSETPFSYFLSTRMRELEPGFCIAPWHSTVASPTVDMVLAPNCGRRETVSLLKGAVSF